MKLKDRDRRELVLEILHKSRRPLRMTDIARISRRNDMIDIICEMADKKEIVLINRTQYMYGLKDKRYYNGGILLR